MLSLTRKAGESIRIGDNVTITIWKIRTQDAGGKKRVVLTIDAPKEIPIFREEVYQKRVEAGMPPAKLVVEVSE